MMMQDIEEIARVECFLDGEYLYIDIVFNNGDWVNTYFDLHDMGPYGRYGLDWEYFKKDD
jgi:hypothetical protein